MARAKELAEKQASNISGHNNSRNNVNRVKRLKRLKTSLSKSKNPPKDSKKDSRESVRVAQQQTQKQSPPNSSDDGYTFAVSSSKITNIQIQINGTPIAVTIDSGATTNILDSEAFASVESNGKRTISTFYVVNGKAGSLLGNETAAELGILKIKVNEVSKFHSMKTTGSRGRNEINTGSHSNGSDANSQSDSGNREIRDRNSMKNIDINTQKILDKFPELSDGIRWLQNYEQSLHVDRTVSPIAQRPRTVPFHLRKQVSDKLEELQSLDIIELAEGPTSWVSPIVAASKPHNSDEIRLCGDYRRPNQALLRERHPIPTVDELMEEMSEVFQNAIQQALQGLHGVRNIADDIIVWGKTQTQHDKNLEALLQRLVVKKLTLNLEKCKFNQPSLWFYGYILSKDGLSANPKKVEAIKNFKTPADVSQLRSFLGLLHFSFSSLQHNDGPVEHHVVRNKEEKEKIKVHADRRNNAKESQLKVGDYVLMQVPKDNKLSMPFNPKPFKVIEIKGNMVTARNTERTVTRNVSCFKCLTNYKNASEEDQNDEEDDFDDGIVENQQPTIVEEQQQDQPDLQRRYCLRQNRRPPDFYRS
ncbi:Transposon Ty3-I Gag-Pol poly [Paramuricea clavata]|uniref:Transposon Ty3-I Gag-Pol poly n=1 Tax=Paramuricea clavata TaxID=317549 RepID=A0A7D9IGS9_PARCT|nr:Transposon Ty3-I Gag-Pol poly [Paramuricea clavata]